MMSISGFIAFYIGVYYVYRIIFVFPEIYTSDPQKKKEQLDKKLLAKQRRKKQ